MITRLFRRPLQSADTNKQPLDEGLVEQTSSLQGNQLQKGNKIVSCRPATLGLYNGPRTQRGGGGIILSAAFRYFMNNLSHPNKTSALTLVFFTPEKCNGQNVDI